jgi:hypothetical protein
MTTDDDDPIVACEPADNDEQDEDGEVPDDEDPASEEAGYGYGV